MYLHEMRKMAGDLAQGDAEAAKLLQHSDVSQTRMCNRTKDNKLAPVR